MEYTLEAACRRILGNADPLTFKELYIGQTMEARAMLEDGWPVDLVSETVDLLHRIGWFRLVGIRKAPWEITDADWTAMIAAAPWSSPAGRKCIRREKQVKNPAEDPEQLDFFGPDEPDHEQLDLFAGEVA